MSKLIPKPKKIQSTEGKNESPATVTTKSVDENGLMAEHARDDGVEENKGEEVAAEFAVNGIGEPQKAFAKMDPSSLELSDNDFNSTDSDSFAGRSLKNRSLEMKLSAIIEKACSSDVEAEDVPKAVPTLSAANVTVTLPNNQLLFTVEGVTVPPEPANHTTGQETAVLPAESAKNCVPARKKKYMYKLKSKAGTVLTYTSYVPVVLKKPRIILTRIDVGAMFDVAAKTNRGKRKASTAASLVNGKRGRGRSTKKSSPPATVDDASDATDVKFNDESTNSSFGMQTRKRKLKFGSDGRIVCIAKRRKSSSSSAASSISDNGDDPPTKESTDEDWEATGDDLRKLNALSEGKEATLVESKPGVMSQTSKSAKSATPKSAKSVTPKSAKVASVLAQSSDDAGKAFNANNAASEHTISTPKPVLKGSVVNPAQLLSTLLGVTIRPSQLNTVRFKPKSVQKQHPSLQKTIVLTGEELRGVASNLGTSTTMKATTPRPLMQKIFPKSSLTSIFNKTVDTKPSLSIPSISLMALHRDLVSPEVTPATVEEPCEEPSFDNFTDSRTVRTKAGPKKFLLQKERLELGESKKLNRLTVYDLAQSVFDRMPSWNLHVMPDSNTFCIAQVGRGRMGIPILRKSVELNDDFAAKIFVHQLHCKKFDGVYDTEAKINALIADIDSVAA